MILTEEILNKSEKLGEEMFDQIEKTIKIAKDQNKPCPEYQDLRLTTLMIKFAELELRIEKLENQIK